MLILVFTPGIAISAAGLPKARSLLFRVQLDRETEDVEVSWQQIHRDGRTGRPEGTPGPTLFDFVGLGVARVSPEP